MATGRGPSVSGVRTLDIEHLEIPGAICVYLVDGPEPVLVDPGPTPALPKLKEELAALGLPLREVRHLLLTHVHLDHAGAAGHIAQAVPEITIHVHEDGAPHIADPERLVRSTRRTFGEAHDRLWGEVLPVPPSRIRGWRPGDGRPIPRILPLPTPGHIAHHLAFESERHGVLFAGDSLGIILGPGVPTHPPTPPPSVDLDAWERTLVETLAPVEVDYFGVTHFGLHADLHGRRAELHARLVELASRVRTALEREDKEDGVRYHEEVVRALSKHLPEGRAAEYFGVFPAETDWGGMRFFLDRNPEWRSRGAEGART